MAWEKFRFAETDTVLCAKILMCDELAEFVETSDRKQMRLVDKFQDNIQSIARLGRSAHVHIVLATQSASGNLFPSSLKNNISFRTICGRVDANISRMAIDSEEGESLPRTPGSYLGWSKGESQQLQGWYTPTKTVLSLGTVKDGFDRTTGLPVGGDSFDMSPVDDIVEIGGSSEEDIDDDSEELLDEIEIDDIDEFADEVDIDLDTDIDVAQEHKDSFEDEIVDEKPVVKPKIKINKNLKMNIKPKNNSIIE